MSFSSILGHDAVVGGLRAAIANDRVSHAYLFSGPQGVGKRKVALAFLQRVNCVSPVDEEGCGTCRTCRQFAAGTHPDLMTLEPDGRFIKIDAVREVTRALRFPPVEARWRCVLIERAEALHEAAGNALLKTLEEPAARNLFVLITAQPNALLPTIVSRCQQVRFGSLSRETVAHWLTTERGLDAQTAHEVSGMAEGSLSAADAAVDPEQTALRRQWLNNLTVVPQSRPAELLELASTLASDKRSMPQVLDAVRLALRDAMLRSAGAGEDRLVFRAGDVPTLSTEAALSALDSVEEAEQALLSNVNPKMVSERLLIGLRRAMQ